MTRAEIIKKAQLANIIKKAKNGKVLTDREMAIIEDFEDKEKLESSCNNALIVSVVLLAGFFKVSTMTITNWLKAGMPKLSRGKYNLQDCFEWWLENVYSPKSVTDKARSDHERYMCAKADGEEIKVFKLKGQLAPIDEFEKQEAYRMACLRGSLLAMPGRLALPLEGKPQEEIREILKREIFTVLEQFRRNKSYLAEGTEPIFEDTAEEAEPVIKPVKRKATKKKKKVAKKK